MKIAIICPDYPSDSSGAFAFVHTRVKMYQEYGLDVEIFVKSNDDVEYIFDEVSVHKTTESQFCHKVRRFDPDVLVIHYPIYWMIPIIKNLDYPKVVWLHGHEILWNFRLMAARNQLDWLKKRIVLLPRLAYQIYSIGNFLQQVKYCVFVSNWLLKAASKSSMREFKNAVVIPNPVDTKLFSYQVPRNISNGISVRSLERTVYGLDIAIKAFAEFEQASLSIYGKGRFYNKYNRLVERLESNTTIHCDHIKHDRLPGLYHQYGFFVAPSRRETQGLAMCEAMACGLPVIATHVGGIPEYVRDGIDGYLVPRDNSKALRDAITRLLSDRDRYYEMSKNARGRIESICDANYITERELEILKNV